MRRSCLEHLKRALKSMAAVGAVLAIMAAPSHAETEDVYTLRAVPVDATAGEAAEARVIAIRQGRSKALRMLFQRLTLQSDWPNLPQLSTGEVTALGAGFEISNERNSPTRYLATINFRFKPHDVRDVLQQFDIPFSEVQARPMVVLPVYVEGDSARIFQDDREWSAAWADKAFEQELVPVKVPLGDLGDVIATPVEAALTDDYAALSGFADRYGVEDILVARMNQREPGGFISFEFVRLSPTETESWTMKIPDTEHIELLMQMAIARGLAKLQEDWKAQTIIRYDTSEVMVVSARFEKISQWLTIKRAMQGTPNITDSRLIALSTGGAHMEWDVVGSPGQLALALAQHSVALNPAKRGDAPGLRKEPEGLDDDGYGQHSQQGQSDSDYPTPWSETESVDHNPFFGVEEAVTRDRVSDDDEPAQYQGEEADNWADGLLETPFDPQSDDDALSTFQLDDEDPYATPDTSKDRDALQEGEQSNEPLDAGAALALMPVATQGGFYQVSDDAQGVDFGNVSPDFWVVKFAPKVEAEVWPTGQNGEADLAPLQENKDRSRTQSTGRYNEGIGPDYRRAPGGAN